MPVLSTVGAASLRAFGAFRPAGASGGAFIVASGGTVSDSGNYRYHTFTADANFVVTNAPADKFIDYLLVGAGGGGRYGAGGGGGGVVIREGQSIFTGSYPIDVGIGYPFDSGSSFYRILTGANTTAFGLVAIGGGGGGAAGSYGSFGGLEGSEGGSGGGGSFVTGYFPPPPPLKGGAGIQPTSASGGYGSAGAYGSYAGAQGLHGGGGGANSAGSGVNPGDGISGAPLTSAIVGGGGWGGPLYSGYYDATKWNQFDPNARSYGFGGGNGPSGTVEATQGVVIVRYLFQ